MARAVAPFADVSETALWVAAYRAWESARPDALFHDPHAAELAGERGEELARSRLNALGAANGWPIVARTKLLDDIVHQSIADGCTCVLNLAAGLDARPYRMNLPPALRWIEVDVPAIFDRKERVLERAEPRCKLERIAVDLADAKNRQWLFDRVDASGEKTLVITEGLVLYLSEATVAELGRDIKARKSFAYWALDFPSPVLLRDLQRGIGISLENAPMQFGPENGVAFFEKLGFHASLVHSLFHEGARMKRVPWPMRLFAFLPAPDARAPGKERWSGVVRLEKAITDKP